MKNVILIFLACLSINVFAQKEVKEGVMTTKMTMSSENAEVSAQLSMMGDMIMTTYFKDNKSRSEMSNPMAGNNTTILDNKSKKILVLMDNMAGKKYMTSDIETSEEDLKGLTITTKNENKTILGYACKGYDIVGKKDGADVKMTMYTTDKIVAPNQNSTSFGSKIKGTPLYMIVHMNRGGMPIKMTMEVTEVKAEKVDDGKFSMDIPDGFEKLEIPKPAKID